MTKGHRNIQRERKTIEAMIALFCRDQHESKGGLCAECAALAVYALQRIEHCPYGEDKPTCAKCPIHCYKPERREQIRVVMRYSGPRMLLHRPILTLGHMIEGRKAAPATARRRTGERATRGEIGGR
jgi:hypothetical protein